jgi:hypothetical protein
MLKLCSFQEDNIKHFETTQFTWKISDLTPLTFYQWIYTDPRKTLIPVLATHFESSTGQRELINIVLIPFRHAFSKCRKDRS